MEGNKNISKFTRVLALMIVFVTVLAFPINVDAAGTVTEQDVWTRIDRLVQLFPHGSFFTVNGEACTDDIDTWSDGTTTCGHPNPCPTCHLPKVLSSNRSNILTAINEAPALKQLIKTKSSSSCLAFATFAYCYIFGHDYLNNSTKITSQKEGITEEFLDSLRVGDFVVCYLGDSKKHYNIYLGHDDNYVYFYESNRFKPSMFVYEGKQKRGDGVITYNSGTTKWDKLVAYRSNTYETSASNVYFTHGSTNETDTITSTNAIVHATLHKPSSATSQKFGIRIKKSSGSYKEDWDYIHNASLNRVGYTTHKIWFDINAEVGYVLEPSTSYMYQLYAMVDGKEYFSTEKTFTTKSGALDVKYKLISPDGYQRIRLSPSESATKVYDMPTNIYVTVTQYNSEGTWGYVSYNGYNGWIKLDEGVNVIKHTTHTYGAWSTTSNATCTAAGSKARSCTVCGASETQSIPALGHNWSSSWTVDKAASCTAAGSKSHHCTRCTAKTDVTVIPKLEHTFGAWSTTSNATCTAAGSQKRTCSCGASETQSIPALDHNWSTAWTVDKAASCTTEGSKSHHCTRCTAKTDVTVIPKLEHTFGAWSTTSNATCTARGTEVRSCSVCGASEAQSTPPLGHAEVFHEAKIPTCTEIGWDAYSTCSRCDYTTYSELGAAAHSYKNGNCTVCGVEVHSEGLEYALSADGMSYKVIGIGTCKDTDVVIPSTYLGISVTSIGDAAFQECSSITSVKIPNSVKSIGGGAFIASSIQSITIPDGVERIEMSTFMYCDSLTSVTLGKGITIISSWAFQECTSLTSIVIPDKVTLIGAIAFGDCTSLESIVIGKSVEKINGRAFNGCSSLKNAYYCGTAEQWLGIEIDPNGNNILTDVLSLHKYSKWEAVTAAGCSVAGVEAQICELCNDMLTRDIPALGHDWESELTIDTEPTCTTAGSKSRHCSRCEETTEITDIPAAGHSYGDWNTIVASTCLKSGLERRTCSGCSKTENRIIPSGHSFGKWEMLAEPTKTSQGFRSRYCAGCGEEELEMLNMIGDLDGDGVLGNSDITMYVRMLGGFEYEYVDICVDFTADGKINNRDIIAVIRKVAGWEE